MTSSDPLLGTPDEWRGDLIVEADEVPSLYQSDSSHYSTIVRLCLEEKRVKWNSRFLDAQAGDHLQPWYAAISPGICVPTFVHRKKAIPESLDILRYIDATFAPQNSLTPSSQTEKEAMEHLIQVGYKFDVEYLTYGHGMKNPLLNRIMRKKAQGFIDTLEKMEKEHPELAETFKKKKEQWSFRVSPEGFVGGDPDETIKKAMRSFETTMEKLESQLQSSGGPFICGAQYTLADAVFTAILARAHLASRTGSKSYIEQHPILVKYWATLTARPSFAAADVHTELRISKLFQLVFGKLKKMLMNTCCGRL